jgi:SAM-dependent methyltransferase
VDTTFSCPACNGETWLPVGLHYYWRAEHQANGNWYRDQYVRLCRRVLFEVWFPGADVVILSSRRCATCELTCYCPRPDSFDLEAKYRFLIEAKGVGPRDAAVELDAARAARVYETVCAVQTNPFRVLDVGGGDGRLMLPFLAQGAECYLVDYANWMQQGVQRLGSTLADVPQTMSFDVAICSHVLEHVAYPRRLLEEVRQILSDDGVVYIEVPMEAFRNNAWNPILAEPVTHISFFTAVTLRHLLLTSGYQPNLLEECAGTYEGRPLPVIRAVATKISSVADLTIPNQKEHR